MRSSFVFLGAVIAATLAASTSCGLPGATGSSGFGGAGGSGGAASASASGTAGGTAGGLMMATSGGAGGKSPFTEMSCGPHEFIVGLNGDGTLLCGAIDSETIRAVNSSCSTYLGWRDSCAAGCSMPPSNWSGGSGDGCVSDMSNGDFCMQTPLGTDNVDLGAIVIGPNTVDDNDRFYGTLHCKAPTPVTPHPLPCKVGEAVVAVDGDKLLCGAMAAPAISFVKQSCGLILGWEDSCQPCMTDVPTAWGIAGDTVCVQGQGSNTRCDNFTLGTEQAQVYSFNTGGTVNDDDDFFVGLSCKEPPAVGSRRATTCAPAELAVGTHEDGTLECANVDQLVYAYFTKACSVYLGWVDCNGDGCTAPEKWGYASGVGCADPTMGQNDICVQEAPRRDDGSALRAQPRRRPRERHDVHRHALSVSRGVGRKSERDDEADLAAGRLRKRESARGAEDAESHPLVREARLGLERLVELALVGLVKSDPEPPPELRCVRERRSIAGLERWKRGADDFAHGVGVDGSVTGLHEVGWRRHRFVAGRDLNLQSDRRAGARARKLELLELGGEALRDGVVGELGLDDPRALDPARLVDLEHRARLAVELLVLIRAEAEAGDDLDPEAASGLALDVGGLVRPLDVDDVDDDPRRRMAGHGRKLGGQLAEVTLVPPLALVKVVEKRGALVGHDAEVEPKWALEVDLDDRTRARIRTRNRTRT